MQALKDYLESFTPISPAAWEAFRALFTPQCLSKNDFFAQPGEVATKIGFLLRGTVRAYYASQQGVEYNKIFNVPCCFIGAYSSLTTRRENRIHIQALEPCQLLVADYRRAIALYDTYPDLERMARRLAESYFVQKEKREIELVLLDAEARYTLFQQEFPGLENKIPQYHIASYLGITPTQLSRIRAKKSSR